MHKKLIIDFNDLAIDTGNIGRILGYKTGEAEVEIQEMIQEVLKELSLFCTIKAEYRIFNRISFNSENHSIDIEGVTFSTEKIVFNQLKKSESLALFICSAGDAPQHKSSNAMKDGDLLKGYLYDLAGSEIAEAAADYVQNDLNRYALLTGLLITNRYSPGYCGWDVSEQHNLFSLMPDNFCGISLSESALMQPVKSVSGIIGIGKKVKSNPYTCNICSMEDCIYRNIKARDKE